jgi:hypothetical protein
MEVRCLGWRIFAPTSGQIRGPGHVRGLPQTGTVFASSRVPRLTIRSFGRLSTGGKMTAPEGTLWVRCYFAPLSRREGGTEKREKRDMRGSCVAVLAAAALAASCTIVVALESGTGTATGGARPVKPPTVVPPPPPPPQFNAPGAQAAPLRSGNPANQGTRMSLIAPQGWELPSGGRPRVTRKGRQFRARTTERNVDKRFEICRGC